MIHFPFSKKLDKGIHDVVAFGSIDVFMEEQLLHRVDISTDAPILVKLISTTDENVSGTDMNEKLINANLGKMVGYANVATVYFNPTLVSEEDVQTVKTYLVKEDKVLLDEKDAIVVKDNHFIVLRVVCFGETTIAGNFLWTNRKIEGQ